MTKEVWVFESETQRKLAYICGLAYSYPHRFTRGEHKHISVEDLQECAALIADDRELRIDTCIRFAAQCPQGTFNPDNLGILMDDCYHWGEFDEVNGLPDGTTAAIAMNIDDHNVHLGDSRPED